MITDSIMQDSITRVIDSIYVNSNNIDTLYINDVIATANSGNGTLWGAGIFAVGIILVLIGVAISRNNNNNLI
jgi:hypothetical protein